jgi:hypothetical protein
MHQPGDLRHTFFSLSCSHSRSQAAMGSMLFSAIVAGLNFRRRSSALLRPALDTYVPSIPVNTFSKNLSARACAWLRLACPSLRDVSSVSA